MNKRRSDISKAEQQANQIITQAEVRKQKYLQDAHNRGMKEVQRQEEELKTYYAQKKYDLTSEQDNLERGRVQNIEQVRDQYNSNSETVVDFLINQIVKVDLSVQRNIIGDFQSLKQRN